jgi:hypothetical protein
MYCHNQLLVRLQEKIIFSNKDLISLNVNSKPFESIILDEISLNKNTKYIFGPSLVGFHI